MRRVLQGKHSINNKYVQKCIPVQMKTDVHKFYNMLRAKELLNCYYRIYD